MVLVVGVVKQVVHRIVKRAVVMETQLQIAVVVNVCNITLVVDILIAGSKVITLLPILSNRFQTRIGLSIHAL